MVVKETINWGIFSTGDIASKMADALKSVKGANLLAVASRDEKRAKEFAQKHGINYFYGTYDELLKNPEIDIVYIATPNSLHYENMLQCLNNGKSVLCEKPFTMDYNQAKEVVDLAREKNLFVMEAHKSFFLPGIKKIEELIKNDAIGKVKFLRADFCFLPPKAKEYRLLYPEFGGGALLDVGCYAISFANYFLGNPIEVISQTDMNDTEVDGFSAISIKHESGANSLLSCSINFSAPREGLIVGESGYIKIHEPFHQAPRLTVKSADKPIYEIDTSFSTNGLDFEAQCATDCLLKGKTECEIFPAEKTLQVMKVIDEVKSAVI